MTVNDCSVLLRIYSDVNARGQVYSYHISHNEMHYHYHLVAWSSLHFFSPDALSAREKFFSYTLKSCTHTRTIEVMSIGL